MVQILNKKYSFSKLSLSILVFSLVLFFLVDAFYKVQVRTGMGTFRPGIFVKGLFEIFVLFYALFHLTKQKIQVIFGIIILSLFFIIGQYTLSFNEKSLNFAENLNRLFKYLFYFVTFLLAIDILNKKRYPEVLFKVYKTIVLVNAVAIIIGFLFSIDFLKTYAGPWRFGYDGLIYAQNEATYFIVLALTTFYYRRFYLGIKEWYFWLVLISSLLVATKAVYLYIALLLLFHLTQKISIKKLLISIVSLGLLFYFVFSTTINKILYNAWLNFQYSYDKKGLLFAILSGRNEFFETKLFPLIIKKWSFLNFLVGGQDAVKHYIEMGFFDLFLFFGFLGGLLYLYMFIKIFNLISFEYKFKLFFFLALMGIVFLSGHFFTSSIVALYFIVFVLVNHYHYEVDTEIKE